MLRGQFLARRNGATVRAGDVRGLQCGAKDAQQPVFALWQGLFTARVREGAP